MKTTIKKMVQQVRKTMTIKGFFDREYKQYATYDNERKIANLIDGLKITQRKVIYTSIKRGENADQMKVNRLASFTAAETDYHHGEDGISGVICNMAQNFPGANNINLMEPLGQFGSQLNPIPSSARYIHTKLSPLFRSIFKKDDDYILNHLYSDDLKIEPDFYLPIIPMILVNGSEGMGVGFAHKFFAHNPEEIKQDILAVLQGKTRVALKPWHNGWKGTVSNGENELQFIFTGIIEKVNTTTLRITELPIGMYLDDIKTVLKKLKDEEFIKDYDDDSTPSEGYNITITAPRTTCYMDERQLLEKFKLISKDTMNLTAWIPSGCLKNFKSVREVVDFFVDFRLTKYEERRLKLIELSSKDLGLLNEKLRFIQFYLKNTSKFSNQSKAELTELLTKNKFNEIDKLLGMQIWSLTKDEIEKLENRIRDTIAEVERLNKITAKQMYLQDLKTLKL